MRGDLDVFGGARRESCCLPPHGASERESEHNSEPASERERRACNVPLSTDPSARYSRERASEREARVCLMICSHAIMPQLPCAVSTLLSLSLSLPLSLATAHSFSRSVPPYSPLLYLPFALSRTRCIFRSRMHVYNTYMHIRIYVRVYIYPERAGLRACTGCNGCICGQRDSERASERESANTYICMRVCIGGLTSPHRRRRISLHARSGETHTESVVEEYGYYMWMLRG